MSRSLLGKPERQFIAEHVEHAQLVLEIGCWEGGTSIIINANMEESAVLHCVDPWIGRERARKVFMDTFQTELKNGQVVVHHMTSDSAYREVFEPAFREMFDLILIDGAHNYNDVRADIINYRPMVKPGGILCGDDYHEADKYFGLKAAVDELVPDRELIRHLWWTNV